MEEDVQENLQEKENPYEISIKDYEQLSEVFRDHLMSIEPILASNEHLRFDVESFIKGVGEQTKKMLTKYAEQAMINQQEVNDWKDKYQAINHKNVQMKLSLKQVENAVNSFVNVSKR